jgi:glutaredoxin 3
MMIAVFSKSYCPYCKATKALLTDLGANYFSIELDQVGMSSDRLNFQLEDKCLQKATDDGAAIQAALKEINGQSSVPNIYIKKEHIGGNSDLQKRKKELPELLKEAGAL